MTVRIFFQMGFFHSRVAHPGLKPPRGVILRSRVGGEEHHHDPGPKPTWLGMLDGFLKRLEAEKWGRKYETLW